MSRLPRLLSVTTARSLILFAVGAASLLPAVAQKKVPAATGGTQLSPIAQQQIAAFSADKAARTPAQNRIASPLLYEIKQRVHAKLPGGLKALQTGVEATPAGLTLLDAKAIVTAGLVDDIQKTGGSILSASAQWHRLRFWYPLDKLERLAEHPEFTWIRPAVPAESNIGSVTSEGDITHRADFARSFYNINGSGVKVGVISDSIDFFARSQASGDLGTISYVTGQSGSGTGEGTAMMEIVHDLAPGAALYFATGFSGQAQFAANILALRDLGCGIIVDDVSYADESPFQDDIIAQAVQDVANSGVLYFSSAGNSGNLANSTSSVWEGDFSNSGITFTYNGNNVGKAHTFGGSTFNTVQSGGSQRRLNLFWSDALDHSGNDYDVYVLDAANNVLALSNNVQDGNDDPYEAIASVSPGNRILIVAYNNPQARYLHLNVGRGRLQYATSGRITGHNGTSGMLSVAAVDVRTTSSGTPFVPSPFYGGPANPVEAFSSEGPRRMFYTANGTALTPGNVLSSGGTVLNKPDIAAADGAVTSFPLNGGLNPFYGTSAAAPHAGAIAALLKSYQPTATATQVSAALIGSARDIMFAGWDSSSGAGIVTAFDAVGGLLGNGKFLFNRGSLTGSFPIDGAAASDRYAFSLESDTYAVEMIATANQGSLAVNIAFYDQDGTSLLAAAYGGYGAGASVSIPHLGPGTYYVVVSQSSGTGSYTLTNSVLTPAPLPTDVELNDTYTLANSLPYLGEKRGRLGYSRTAFNVQDEIDWHKVTVTEEGDFTVTAEALTGELAVNVYFYDQDGTTNLAVANGGYGGSPSFVIPHLGPGTYYVLVQRAGGFGNYRLSNTIVKDPIPSDQENNDDVDHALTLPYGGNKKGRLGYSRLPYSTQDELDWYKVTVPDEGDLTVTAAALTDGLAVNVYFYDQDKTTNLAAANGGYGGSPSFVIPHLGPGTYYVLVQRAGGYGSYQLSDSMVQALPVDETEINDTAPQANTLTLNGSLRGKLGYSRNPYGVADEQDWYKVTVTGDGDFDARVQPDNSGLAVNIYVFDQDGATNLVASNGGYGSTIDAPLSHVGPGTYYVLVQRAGGYGRYTVSNTLSLQTTPSDPEINDAMVTATVSNINAPRTGRLGYSRNPYGVTDDQDWYRVMLSGDLTLNVQPTEGLAVNLGLYDSNGGNVATTNGGYGSQTTLAATGLASGTYYILIQRSAGYGAYNMSIPAATVSGTLTLEGIIAGAASQPIDFVFRPGDNSGDFTQTVSVAPNGAFSFPGIPRKNYTVHIKGARYLARNVAVNVSGGNVSGVSALLRAGDSNGDNAADITDLLALVAHYNKTSPNGGYAASVDFNLDGTDDITDLLLLIHSYNQHGDN